MARAYSPRKPLTVPRVGSCADCGCEVATLAPSSPLPKRCRECKLATWRAYQKRTSPPRLVVLDRCTDCNVEYERSSRATTRVRCEPCRVAYKAEFKKRYAAEHPEVHRAASLKWNKANPDFVWNAAHHRRVLERSNAKKFSRVEVYERDEWVCQLCMLPVDSRLRFPDPQSASIDHVTAVAHGGDHSLANVQLAHLVCNQRKGARRG